MRLLITGHEGFIGSKLWEAIDILDIGAVELIGRDIQSSTPLTVDEMHDLGPDIVVNLAATIVGETEESYHADLDVALVVAAYCRTTETPVFHSSSVAAATHLAPVHSYAHRKQAQEWAFLQDGMPTQTHVMMPRFNNIVGDGQAPPSLHGSLMHAAASHTPLVIHGGHQWRSFIHVDGVVAKILEWIGAARALPIGVFKEEWTGVMMSVDAYVDHIKYVKRLAVEVVHDSAPHGPDTPPGLREHWPEVAVASTLM